MTRFAAALLLSATLAACHYDQLGVQYNSTGRLPQPRASNARLSIAVSIPRAALFDDVDTSAHFNDGFEVRRVSFRRHELLGALGRCLNQAFYDANYDIFAKEFASPLSRHRAATAFGTEETILLLDLQGIEFDASEHTLTAVARARTLLFHPDNDDAVFSWYYGVRRSRNVWGNEHEHILAQSRLLLTEVFSELSDQIAFDPALAAGVDGLPMPAPHLRQDHIDWSSDGLANPSLWLSSIVQVKGESIGSGFGAADARTIVTAYHVVGDRAEVGVRTFRLTDNDIRVAQSDTARVVHTSRRHDIAILKLADDSHIRLRPRPLSGVAPALGSRVHKVGSPFIDDVVVRFNTSTGLVTAPPQERDAGTQFVHSVDIEPGDSGGPLLDDRGRVVGMNLRDRPDDTAFNFAVGANIIADELERSEHKRRP